MLQKTLLVIFICVFSFSAAAQTLYKTIGANGKVTYSDTPPQAGKTQKLQFKNAPSSQLNAETETKLKKMREYLAAKPTETQKNTDQATLYTTSWCGYCKKAKKYLSSRSIAFREIDIETESGMQSYAAEGGSGGVPLLIAKNQKFPGFSESSYDSIFGNDAQK